MAVAGTQLPSYVVSEPLSKGIAAFLHHGNRCRVAMGAYGYTLFGDLAQGTLKRYTCHV